jgi:hypothetical protein
MQIKDLFRKAVLTKSHMDNIAADHNLNRINVAQHLRLSGIRNIIPMEILTTK